MRQSHTQLYLLYFMKNLIMLNSKKYKTKGIYTQSLLSYIVSHECGGGKGKEGK